MALRSIIFIFAVLAMLGLVQAHTVSRGTNVAVSYHIEPEEPPATGQNSSIIIEVYGPDNPGEFLKGVDVNVRISQNQKLIYQKSFSNAQQGIAVPMVFDKAVYLIEVTVKPSSSFAGKAFSQETEDFVVSLVAPGENPTTTQDFPYSSFMYIVGTALLLVAGILWFFKIRKR